MAKRVFRASVTWESKSVAPETVRTQIVAASWQSAASQAVRVAKKASPGKRASSLVVVLEPEEAS